MDANPRPHPQANGSSLGVWALLRHAESATPRSAYYVHNHPTSTRSAGSTRDWPGLVGRPASNPTAGDDCHASCRLSRSHAAPPINSPEGNKAADVAVTGSASGRQWHAKAIVVASIRIGVLASASLRQELRACSRLNRWGLVHWCENDPETGRC